MRYTWILIVSIVTASTLFGLDFYGNESRQPPRSTRTNHFDFHYESHLTQQAQTAAEIAEEMYDSISVRYPSYTPRRMDFTINNALYSNGSANFLQSSINIWLTDWGIKLRSTHNWLADVVTHEFAHIISIQSGVKTKPYVYTGHLLSTDYADARVRKDISFVLPNFIQPHWLAEGTAQYESERMGFDAWDSHRDMILRVASLNSMVLPIEKMNSFTSHGLEVEQGPYTQGFSLVRYIAEKYGDTAIPKLWDNNATWYRATFSASLYNILGVDQSQLYENWKNYLLNRYTQQDSIIGEEIKGDAFTTDRIYYDHPKVTDTGDLYVVAGEDKTSFQGALAYVPIDSLALGVFEEELESTLRTESFESAFLDPVWSKGFDVISRDSVDYIAYVSAKERDRRGTRYFDIRIACRGAMECEEGEGQSVTYLSDAINPAFSPDGTEIVFVRRNSGTALFSLSKIALDSLMNPVDEIIDLITFVHDTNEDSLITESVGAVGSFNVYTPTYSPNGKNIVLSYYQNGVRSIAIVDNQGKNIRTLKVPALESRDPSWLNDSMVVFSANIPISSDTLSKIKSPTIFNLYSYRLGGSNITRLTNVLGGAFTPTYSDADTTLFYTLYDSNGFSLYRLPLSDTLSIDSRTFVITIDSSSLVKHKSEHEENNSIQNFHADQDPYSTLPRNLILSPLYINEESPVNMSASETERVHKIGISALINDPLNKNEISVLFLMQVDKFANPFSLDYGINPEVSADMMLQWRNKMTPVTFDVAAMQSSRQHIDTATIEAGGGVTETRLSSYAVKMNGITGTAQYSVFKKGDFIRYGTGYSWASFNFYSESNGLWDFSTNYFNTLQLGIEKLGRSFDAEGLTSPGVGVSMAYNWSLSELFRPGGDFSNSFTYNSGSVREQKMTDYSIMESSYGAFISLKNPLLKDSRIVTKLSASVLVNWNADKPDSDTTIGLDNYFRHGLMISGYPYVSGEDLALLGENTLMFSVEHQLALIKDIHKSFWIVHLKDLYFDCFFQSGKAWDGKFHNYITNDEYKDFYRSWGFGLRFTQKIFYHYPFQLYVRYAKALDPDLPNGSKVSTISMGLPSAAEPTKIEFGFHIDIPSNPSVDFVKKHPYRNGVLAP